MIVASPQRFDDVLRRTSEVLLETEVPMILWGENALIQYRIPAAVIVSLRFDDQFSVFVDLLY